VTALERLNIAYAPVRKAICKLERKIREFRARVGKAPTKALEKKVKSLTKYRIKLETRDARLQRYLENL
jgi:hypothetical protein